MCSYDANSFQELVTLKLQDSGAWRLSSAAKSVLRCHMHRLPRRKVSEMEERYPESPAAMRAFLVKFFARYYSQIQNSLITYMTSEEFLTTMRSGRIRVLDIGSGPGIAYLAIADLLEAVLQSLYEIAYWPRIQPVRLDCVLNDTSGYCLGTARQVIQDYFRLSGSHRRWVSPGKTLYVAKPFPDNMGQLRRIGANVGLYDIGMLSYAVSPLHAEGGMDAFLAGLVEVSKCFCPVGRILILQDKFQESIMRRISRYLKTPARKLKSLQQVYPRRYSCDTYTYSYYACLYEPEGPISMHRVPLPWHAVAS